MQTKILVSILFFLSVSSSIYVADNSTQSQNKTIEICKFSGATAGALIGGYIGYILRQKMKYFAMIHSGLNNSQATNFQFAVVGAADGLIEVLCQWGSLYVGYLIGDKLGAELGF